jgi:predicted sulfurtransferase
MKPTSLFRKFVTSKVDRERMKRVLSILALGVLVAFAACTNTRNADVVQRISKDELKAELGSPNVVIIDVRIKNDWEGSDEKISGAVRMDPQAVDTWAPTLPKDKELVLYCA